MDAEALGAQEPESAATARFEVAGGYAGADASRVPDPRGAVLSGKRHKRQRETFVCPHCGADVGVTAAVCRECGSDADTGWQSTEEVEYQSLDLPQGYRDDDAYEPTALPPSRRSKWFVFVVLLMVVLFVLVFVLRAG